MSKQTEEIRRRLAAATPGPWRVGHDGPSKPIISGAHPRHGMLAFQTFPKTVADLWGFDDLEEENAELIAHAPTDLAFLLAENERLEQTVRDLNSNAIASGNAHRGAVERFHIERERLERENARLAAEHTQYHEWNSKLVTKHYALRTVLDAAAAYIGKLKCLSCVNSTLNTITSLKMRMRNSNKPNSPTPKR